MHGVESRMAVNIPSNAAFHFRLIPETAMVRVADSKAPPSEGVSFANAMPSLLKSAADVLPKEGGSPEAPRHAQPFTGDRLARWIYDEASRVKLPGYARWVPGYLVKKWFPRLAQAWKADTK